MGEPESFAAPEISEDDLCLAAAMLGLPEGAFSGADGTDPRRVVLQALSTLDVAACPGSGKTTILVAKLLLLASKWHYRTRGICALSHTNVARREIETRLGNTVAGRRLLRHPHFVGTVHSFAAEFLCMPWLRALGYPVRVVDSNICENRRWGKVPRQYRTFLDKKNIRPSDIRIDDSSFRVVKKNGKPLCSQTTPTYSHLQAACRQTCEEGYHSFDDLFVWALDYLERCPEVASIVRARFPLLFIDEAQDLTQTQSELLRRVFMDASTPALRQRLGDSNQAIFDLPEDMGAVDPFPNKPVCVNLPHSHRFGQKIADLAAPLGVDPQEVVGRGPQPLGDGATSDAAHTVFLFDETSVRVVLDAYGKKLLQVLPDQALRYGGITAVGQVHQPVGEDPNKFPYSLTDYWPEYDCQLSYRDPMPTKLIQYISFGQARMALTGEAHSALDKIAQGLFRLAGMAGQGRLTMTGQYHRRLLKLLEPHPALRAQYEEMLSRVIAGLVLDRKTWDEQWRSVAQEVAEAIAGQALSESEAQAFLAWAEETHEQTVDHKRDRNGDNIYRYPTDNPRVNIRVGSIHSVKGETHVATLVCETFWYAHNLHMLRPWITGHREGWTERDGPRQSYRLKVHYVAMTRPTHLLCLAMRRSSFETEPGKLDSCAIEALEKRGWVVEFVSAN